VVHILPEDVGEHEYPAFFALRSLSSIKSFWLTLAGTTSNGFSLIYDSKKGRAETRP
jgi:hypothetical protein